MMVNAFTMGYDVIAKIASDKKHNLAIIANGLGLGNITRGPNFRISTELIAKVSRLSGADAFYTGPMVGLIDTNYHSAEHLIKSLTQPFSLKCKRPKSAAVMAGGIGLAEILRNTNSYNGPLFLSMGYRFVEHMLHGRDGERVINFIRDILLAFENGGISEAQTMLEKLHLSGKCQDIIEALEAELALAEEEVLTILANHHHEIKKYLFQPSIIELFYEQMIEDLKLEKEDWKKQAQTLLLKAPDKSVEKRKGFLARFVS